MSQTLNDIVQAGSNAIELYKAFVLGAKGTPDEIFIEGFGDSLTQFLKDLYHSGVEDGLIRQGDPLPWPNLPSPPSR